MSGGFPFVGDVCGGADIGTATASSNGTQVVAGTGGTYGSYAQLVSSTPVDTQWAIFCLAGTATWWQGAFKIAIGASGSERDIANHLLVYSSQSISQAGVPLSIPAGSRVSAAAVVNTAGGNGFITMVLFSGGFSQTEGVAGIDGLGLTSSGMGTAVAWGASVNTKGAYSQLSASTPRDYVALTFAIDGQNNTIPLTSNAILIDIAIGAAGSEQIIVPNLYLGQGAFGASLPGLYPVSVPAGSRVAVRAQSNVNSGALGVIVYGLYQ